MPPPPIATGPRPSARPWGARPSSSRARSASAAPCWVTTAGWTARASPPFPAWKRSCPSPAPTGWWRGNGAMSRRGWGCRARAPGGGVQAADVALRLSGTRSAGPHPPRRRAGGDRPPDRHRGDGRNRPRAGGRHRRRGPDRRAQHAELRAAQAGRTGRQAGAPQAEPVGEHHGSAAVGGVRVVGGESRRHPLRAGHPGLRFDGPESLRPQRHSRGEIPLPPPHHCRPEPRHRAPHHGPADGAGRAGGRRGRPADRGAHRARRSALRRGSEPLPRALRAPDGRAQCDRLGDRAEDSVNRRPALLTLCVFASLRPCVLPAQDALSAVRRAGDAYKSLSSLQADFVQVVQDAKLGDTLKSAGRLFQEGANAFAMRFTDPPDEAIVIDGRYVWVYTPSTTPGQVIRMPMETDPVYGVNLLARILDRPAERYRVTWLRADTASGRPVEVVSLVPNGANLNFTRAVLWLDREDALPRRIELEESPGVKRILTLSRLRPNAPSPPETFVFKVPRGVRVVDQE